MSESFRPGTILGRYCLEERVGQGGMGIVVAAKHRSLRRRVAIKLLAGPGSEGARRRLLREARAAQSLGSENVVAVHDVVDDEHTPYIVMELLEGENVAELLARRRRLPVAEAVDIVVQAANGLAEAHAAGIVHRDVKPSNIFVTQRADGSPDRLVKLLDFGISKTQFADDVVSEATVAKALLGSPHFMSPEQLRDPSKVDARTDIWSLAVTLFTLTTGERPFEGTRITEISAAIVADPPPRLRSLVPDAPEELERAIERALAKVPEKRTSSVLAFAIAIGPFASASTQPLLERLARLEAHTKPSSPREDDAPRELMDPTVTDDAAFDASRDVSHSGGARPRAQRTRGLLAVAILSGASVIGAATYELGARSSGGRHEPESRAPAVPHEPASATPVPTETPVRTAQIVASTGPEHAVSARPALVAAGAPKQAPRSAPGRAAGAEPAASSAPTPAKQSTTPVDIDGIPIVD
jgi:eukaryotic-like serine/threonine-protein kinase